MCSNVVPPVSTDIVEIKHIMLPPNPRDFKDIFVVFELMETDLHQVFPSRKLFRDQGVLKIIFILRMLSDVQVIKANDDLTAEHHQFFLYQMLRGLKYIHTGN